MNSLQRRKGIPSIKGYYLAKSGKRFHYDSMTELAEMLILDKNNQKWIKNTSLRIPYIFESKNRKYIPDFIVNENLILEIKGSNDKPELPYKCEAAIKYCKENNMKFKLISYDEIKKSIDWSEVRKYHNENK